MNQQVAMEYRSSKVSVIIVAILFALELTLLFFGMQRGNIGLAITSIVVSSLIFLNFFCLSVHVSRDGVLLSFGVGLIKREVALEDIQRMDLVPNSSITSLYDPKREHALRLSLRSGGAVHVAVGDARRMMEVISGLNRR